MTWKEKTCEDCTFRVGDECRRFPPSVFTDVCGFDDSNPQTMYPCVEFGKVSQDDEMYYPPACAEYAQVLQPTITIKEATR